MKRDDEKFDEYQLQQFMIAEKTYGNKDSEIRNHPEWSGMFMNFYLNSEGKGEDCSVYLAAARWLSRAKLPRDVQNGTLGNDVEILSTLIRLARAGAALPEELPMRDGAIDVFMLRWVLLEALYGAEGRKRLKSGRFAYGSHVGMLDDSVLFSEGIKEAEEVLDELSWACSCHTKRQFFADDPMAAIGENAHIHLAMKLALDDMNIRGKQVLDAVEYAGNPQELYRRLSRPYPEYTRDPGIARYVNRKAAERIRDGESVEEMVAVNGGASFDKASESTVFCLNPELAMKRYRMTEADYEEYLTDIRKLDVDYRSADVIQGTNLALALNACGARGFRMVRMGGVRDDGSRGALLWNPVTGAFVTFNSAMDGNAVYGGGDLDFFDVSVERIPWGMLPHGSSGGVRGYEGAVWHQLTYHNGLFEGYDRIAGRLCAKDVDWGRIGFGVSGIPCCTYYRFPYMNEMELAEKMGFRDAHMLCSMGGYNLQQFINLVLTCYDDEIDTTWALPYKVLKDDPGQCACTFTIWPGSIEDDMKLMRLAKIMLRIPDGEFGKFVGAFEKRCWDADAGRTDKEAESCIGAFARCQKVLKGFRKEDRIVEALLSAGTPPTECGVKLPWM